MEELFILQKCVHCKLTSENSNYSIRDPTKVIFVSVDVSAYGESIDCLISFSWAIAPSCTAQISCIPFVLEISKISNFSPSKFYLKFEDRMFRKKVLMKVSEHK